MEEVNIRYQEMPVPVAAPVLQPGKFDILCGKGKKCVGHIGSRRFRAVIESYRQRYSLTKTKYEKMMITKEVVERLQKENCRFLKYDASTMVWEELLTMAARDKVGHALRFANRTTPRRKKNPSKTEGDTSIDSWKSLEGKSSVPSPPTSPPRSPEVFGGDNGGSSSQPFNNSNATEEAPCSVTLIDNIELASFVFGHTDDSEEPTTFLPSNPPTHTQDASISTMVSIGEEPEDKVFVLGQQCWSPLQTGREMPGAHPCTQGLLLAQPSQEPPVCIISPQLSDSTGIAANLFDPSSPVAPVETMYSSTSTAGTVQMATIAKIPSILPLQTQDAAMLTMPPIPPARALAKDHNLKDIVFADHQSMHCSLQSRNRDLAGAQKDAPPQPTPQVDAPPESLVDVLPLLWEPVMEWDLEAGVTPAFYASL
ncbi:expressed unknown protein [Seminavis robusta]|uniref:DUF6824 domain-containing protein n=1 Tax=Seminavis robusta TaxID=568900 RepID=A0A9N8HVJ7_9STRA|nr:expressed unknown protein [Seminavis robusta]|eukprot:Sro1818_g299610.1 n/a (425) ;mRNA; r:17991-19344